MKLGRVLLFLTLLTGLNACMWGGNKDKTVPALTKDTLVYTYQTIHERASDCGNKPDSGCTVVKIKYPVFNGQSQLNDSVANRLIMLFALDKKADTSLKQLTQHFLKNYYNDTAPANKSGIIYRFDLSAMVLRQDSAFTTLQIGGHIFQGGAHGGTHTEFINWNTNKSRVIELKDILISGYEPQLNTVAEKIFRAQEKLTATQSLTPDYFFKNGKFELNNNYLITPLGLMFLYNEYEIKPYSGGQTELLIPYSQIRSLLRPNTVVSQYHK